MATINKITDMNIHNDDGTVYNVGYEVLDRVLNGLQSGSLITIGARPAVGKSTFMNNIVLHLLEKYNLPTLYINLIEKKERLMLRLSSVLLETSYNKLRDNMDLKTISLMKFEEKKYNLYISDDCYKINELEQLIEENKDIKFIVIDYIQLMISDIGFNSKTDNFNDVFNRLRLLANKYGLVIFLLSQLSRHVERRAGNRPLIVDLSNSVLESVSDIIILLYRDGFFNEEINIPITEVTVCKNRNGATGMVRFNFNIDKTKFIEDITN